MFFNSNPFLLFFAGFSLAYWMAQGNRRTRNILIVAGSYLFYGWWDYRFLALILVSTFLDYSIGLGLARERRTRRRRLLVTASVAGNLAILGFFKYHGFFVDSLVRLLAVAGIPFDCGTLDVVLPVGISFYTFQTMSYTLDVYRGDAEPTRDLAAFMAYVCFFPQLVAGPIERARHLLPQFQSERHITRRMVETGVWLCIWGMFKKVVIADNLAPMVDLVYGSAHVAAPALVLGTIAFALQIYCDFSGYSDIARGLANLLGFQLMLNFNLPYLATSLRAFWRRWHISLSTWLRDYLYISLGGNRRGPVRAGANVMLTMILGGLWHGAAWHFVAWGCWHGLALIIERAVCPSTSRSTVARVAHWAITLLVVHVGWVFFRAESLPRALTMLGGLGDWHAPSWIGSFSVRLGVVALPLLAMQLWQARSDDPLVPLQLGPVARGVLQGILLMAIIMFWQREAVPFIYFQF